MIPIRNQKFTVRGLEYRMSFRIQQMLEGVKVEIGGAGYTRKVIAKAVCIIHPLHDEVSIEEKAQILEETNVQATLSVTSTRESIWYVGISWCSAKDEYIPEESKRHAFRQALEIMLPASPDNYIEREKVWEQVLAKREVLSSRALKKLERALEHTGKVYRVPNVDAFVINHLQEIEADGMFRGKLYPEVSASE